MSYLSVRTVLVQSEWLNSAPSPVVYGGIALSIKINTKIHKKGLITKENVREILRLRWVCLAVEVGFKLLF